MAGSEGGEVGGVADEDVVFSCKPLFQLGGSANRQFSEHKVGVGGHY